MEDLPIDFEAMRVLASPGTPVSAAEQAVALGTADVLIRSVARFDSIQVVTTGMDLAIDFEAMLTRGLRRFQAGVAISPSGRGTAGSRESARQAGRKPLERREGLSRGMVATSRKH